MKASRANASASVMHAPERDSERMSSYSLCAKLAEYVLFSRVHLGRSEQPLQTYGLEVCRAHISFLYWSQ